MSISFEEHLQVLRLVSAPSCLTCCLVHAHSMHLSAFRSNSRSQGRLAAMSTSKFVRPQIDGMHWFRARRTQFVVLPRQDDALNCCSRLPFSIVYSLLAHCASNLMPLQRAGPSSRPTGEGGGVCFGPQLAPASVGLATPERPQCLRLARFGH